MNVQTSILNRISGAEKLVAVFGCWPSFHDAEVIWLKLDRRANDERFSPSLEIQIHAFEATNNVDEHGYYVSQHHVLVWLRFLNVVELRLDDFNHQNVLFDLRISDFSERQSENIFFEVRFDPSFGMSASFQCGAIEVGDVTPCNEGGVPIAT